MSTSVSRREFLRRSTAAAGALTAVSAAHGENEVAQRPPNVLFLMTDQQRFDGVAANGNRLIETPNLDRLAAESANFSHAFVQSPVCVPSRACYFSGRYASSHRNRVNYTPLDEREILLPARLQEAGYQTAMVGKSHLYYRYPPTADEAKRIGFDEVELHDGARQTDEWSDYATWRAARDPLADVHYRRTARSVARAADGPNPFRSAIADEFTDTSWTGLRTREHLRRLAGEDRPFFLFSSFWKPHSPFEVPTPFDAMYDDVDFPLPRVETLEDIRRLPPPLASVILRGKNPPFDMDRGLLQWILRSYYASISHIDREVGQILDTLKETGQADNTVVVFCSDHGDQLLEHGLMGKNVFFESSIRVPLMVRAPGRVRPGRYDELVESVDVAPTLFNLLGLDEPYDCQGRDLTPLVGMSSKGGYEPRRAVFCENIIPEVITNGGLDFHFTKGEGVKGIRHPDAKMVRTRRWKYNHYPGYEGELYDLENDPGEHRNLATSPEHRPVVAQMRLELLDWLATVGETEQIAPRWVIP